MESNRVDLLRAYLLALFAEGEFFGLSPFEMAKKALNTFKIDLPIALADIAKMSAEFQGRRLSAAALDKVGSLLRDVSKRGFGPVWGEIKEQYQRGVESNARRGK